MLYNYLKIAVRNLVKNKSFSFINIFGLSASLSVCLLIILLIKDAHSYDLFHPDSGRTYRILTTPDRKSGTTEQYASSPFMVGKTLSEDYGLVESWTPLVRGFQAGVQKNNNRIEMEGLFADSNLFELFGFELAKGDPATALSEPFTVVLSHEVAERLYPSSDPVGQSLEMIAYERAFKVTGVLAPHPGKTHLEFDALGALATQMALEREPGHKKITGNWQDYYSTYNFIRLKSGVHPEQAEAALSELSTTRYKDLELETRDLGYRFDLQPLVDITPGPLLSNSMGQGLPRPLLWFLSVLGLIVMFSACFNYTNLTIARALTRVREVGIRKVMGATRWQVIGQFLSEAVVVAMLALAAGFLFLEFLRRAFSSIGTLARADIELQTDASALGIFLAFALLVGLVAGLLPALALSRYTPLIILQKLENLRVLRHLGLRKILIVSQFSISLIFILVLSVAWKQINYATSENFGSGRTDVINVSMQGNDYKKLKAAFSQVAQVRSVSASSHLMGTWQDSKIDVHLGKGDEKIPVRDYSIDHRFIDDLGLELIAGENFPGQPQQKRESFAIVNEKLLEIFQLGTPVEAVGKPIMIGDSTQLVVRGVVKDFLYKPLVYQLEPLLLRYNPDNMNVLHLTIGAQDKPVTLAALERTWKQVDRQQPFEYEFYDETIAANFADVKDMARIVGGLGSLGLLIACLGLLGMAIYTVETKAREVSIRKIIGAGSFDLIRLLSKEYVLMLAIAMLIALPVSYFMGSQLLQTFAFSISLDAPVFLPGILLLLVLGALTIGSQTVRAVFKNPVDHLKE